MRRMTLASSASRSARLAASASLIAPRRNKQKEGIVNRFRLDRKPQDVVSAVFAGSISVPQRR
jgi:hypothetical protein